MKCIVCGKEMLSGESDSQFCECSESVQLEQLSDFVREQPENDD